MAMLTVWLDHPTLELCSWWGRREGVLRHLRPVEQRLLPWAVWSTCIGLYMGLRESCLFWSCVCVLTHIHTEERWLCVRCRWDMDKGSLATDAQTEMKSCMWVTVGLHAALGFVVFYGEHKAQCPGMPSGPSWSWDVVVSPTLSLGRYCGP